jgi:hypothetical protein
MLPLSPPQFSGLQSATVPDISRKKLEISTMQFAPVTSIQWPKRRSRPPAAILILTDTKAVSFKSAAVPFKNIVLSFKSAVVSFKSAVISLKEILTLFKRTPIRWKEKQKLRLRWSPRQRGTDLSFLLAHL